MSALRMVLGDQLTRNLASLKDLDKRRDIVLMAEVKDEAQSVRHHKQKIALIFSAMRHFAQELRNEGVTVVYSQLDDPENSGSLAGEVLRTLARIRCDEVIATAPSEWRVARILAQLREHLIIPLHVHEDDRFFCTPESFASWASKRKTLRMEHFYREMRRVTGLLMDGDRPIGDAWNFDAKNRRPWPKNALAPTRRTFLPDKTTAEAISLVERVFPNHFGETTEFGWPVTRTQALVALEDFLCNHLPWFGDYQDAMKTDAPFLHHSLIAPALNLGLLSPQEICRRAEQVYREGRAPLNAVEGFIRQILGWREYVRGIYWLTAPTYSQTNALSAKRPLPEFFWSGDTEMRCVSKVVEQTRRFAYAHHIQRLMVIGNFALLAGLQPNQVEEWFLIVYADAFEWVELPNTHGMALFADGGLLASKPYAASGAYIARMSDYCHGCRFNPRKKSGPDACPFNPLYWAFLERNRAALANNPRLEFGYRRLNALKSDERAAILAEGDAVLAGLISPSDKSLNLRSS